MRMRNEVQELQQGLQQEEEEETIENKSIEDDKTARLAEEEEQSLQEEGRGMAEEIRAHRCNRRNSQTCHTWVQ
jgi:hypothetical protein